VKSGARGSVKANASRHKAMTYGRMKKAEAELEVIVSDWFNKAEAADLRDDQEHGAELSGEELPDWDSRTRKSGS
jgi:hypothetical protein